MSDKPEYQDEFDEMSAEELKQALREQAQRQAESDESALQGIAGLDELNEFERANLLAQARKVQRDIQQTIASKKAQGAEALLNDMVEQFTQENGHAPGVWALENMKRQLRSQGKEIW